MLITTLRAEADALLQAVAVPNELTGPSRFQRVREALEAYSHAFMDRYTEDVIGNDGRYYQLTGTDSVLNHWHAGLSYVMRIEYPAATLADDDNPQYLEDGVWQGDYEYNGESYLYLRNAAPSATEYMRIAYAVPYLWAASSTTTVVAQTAHGFTADDYVRQDAADDWEAATEQTGTHQVTVVASVDAFTAAVLETNAPTAHFNALINLIACGYCRAIAAKFSRTNDSTIGADSVNHPTRAERFAAQANSFCGAYREMVGIASGAAGSAASAAQASGGFVDMDTAPRWPGGRNYVFHRNR